MIKYPALVKEEAKNLKKFATKEELERLNINTFSPKWPTRCIYGQISLDCYSERASELIEKCCSRVYKAGTGGNSKTGSLSVELNGAPKKEKRMSFWSPIENFIHIYKNRTNGANERLIKYLKGEVKRL